ncbi:unnamed protein product [Dicrocoelium dendriticum]|nr:unnamed protein product [Dicrocoelium dendriticum]
MQDFTWHRGASITQRQRLSPAIHFIPDNPGASDCVQVSLAASELTSVDYRASAIASTSAVGPAEANLEVSLVSSNRKSLLELWSTEVPPGCGDPIRRRF